MTNKILIISFLSILFVACQTSTTENSDIQELEQEEVGIPYSIGPSEAPSVKGPNSPPPSSSFKEASYEAITKKENIILTLPPDNA